MSTDRAVRRSLNLILSMRRFLQKAEERILLIAEGHQILWVVGYRMSSRYQISEHTKRIIEIKIMEDKKHGRDN